MEPHEDERALIAELERLAWLEPPTLGFYVCPACNVQHPSTHGTVTRDGVRYADYRMWANASDPGVWTTLTLHPKPDAVAGEQAVTFGSRFGAADGPDGVAYSLMKPVFPELETAGLVLSPDAARAHPRVGEFWVVTDWLFYWDPLMHQAAAHGVLPDESNWPHLAQADSHMVRPNAIGRLLGRLMRRA